MVHNQVCVSNRRKRLPDCEACSIFAHQTTPTDPSINVLINFYLCQKQYDEEFYRLDQAIAEAAKEIPGYIGEEAWENPTTGLISNVYYWETLEALQSLVQHTRHLEAKAAQSKWLDGYQVVISQVIKTYGDAKLKSTPVAHDD